MSKHHLLYCMQYRQSNVEVTINGSKHFISLVPTLPGNEANTAWEQG